MRGADPQAIAIGLSEARRNGKKAPSKKCNGAHVIPARSKVDLRLPR